MARYQVIIAYDGTDFYGMQRQAGETRTVQGVVEAALSRIGWEGDSTLAAGRTDTGVHASGQVVSFDLDWSHGEEALQNALNANLPPDAAVREVKTARIDFHPRYDAVSRRYRYHLFCEQNRRPLRERYAWRVWPPAALEPMQQAAEMLTGSHDFAAFGSPPREGGSTERTITSATWQEAGQDLVFEVVANAFLYHMVRRLVHLQVEIGQGKAEPALAARYLDGSEPGMVRGLAPPQGLFLAEVRYPGDDDVEK